MLQKVRNAIILKLKKLPFDSEKEAFRYLMAFVIAIFALTVHLLLALIFLLFQKSINTTYADCRVIFMAYNLLSVAIYSFSFVLINKRKFAFFGVLLSIKGILFSALICLSMGLESYGLVYLVLLMMIQIQFPYGGSRLRTHTLIAALLVMLGSLIASYFVEPMFVFPIWLENLMLTLNVSIFVMCVIAVLFIVHFRDQTVKNFSHEKILELSNQSFTDELTGLYNRRYAKNFFKECLASGSSYCVAMLDIDDFKAINDTYGHNCGDEVLVFLADFLAKHLRSRDVLVRWGGEEFLIILVDVAPETAFIVLDKLRAHISKEVICTREKDISITVTIGISKLTADVETAIKSCDQKMYKGKKSGKNIVVM